MSEKQTGPAFWRSFPIFEEFPDDALATLQAVAIHRTWPAGTVLFQRGDEGDHLIALAEGRIKLSLITGAGKELSLRHAEGGSILGDMAVLDGEPRSADAVTVTACEGYVIMRRDVERLIAEHAECALATIRYLSRRLRETTDQMESIALYELDARLARFFLATLRQIHGDDLPDEARIAVALSQGELASVLGASRSKINRAIVSLEEQGAITREDGAISFDIDLLEEIAEPLSG